MEGKFSSRLFWSHCSEVDAGEKLSTAALENSPSRMSPLWLLLMPNILPLLTPLRLYIVLINQPAGQLITYHRKLV